MYRLISVTRKLPALAIVFVTCCSAATRLHAQVPAADTISLSLPEMEKRFLDSNLLLLAAHYNVDAQKALIEQAKLWDNPVLNTDQVIAADGKFFPYGKNPDGSYSGQYYIQVQQLIKTAGKRGKLINMANTNAKISELQLQDVMRNLRYQLRTDYYNLLQQTANRAVYIDQLTQLNLLVDGMQAQVKAGNIAEKELIRLQGLSVSLKQDLVSMNRDIQETESDLKTLLQYKEDIFIAPKGSLLNDKIVNVANAETIFQTAKQNNPNFLLQQAQTTFQEQNLAYQKALRVPDLTVGPNFDRNSNFAPNYVGLGLSIPLPVFNKNQGNIKSASFNVKQQQAFTSNAETELYNNVNNAYRKLVVLQQETAGTRDFYNRYAGMYNKILQSYSDKQIGLLEFLDFFNDYTSALQKQLQEKLNLALSREELNYHAGIDIVQ